MGKHLYGVVGGLATLLVAAAPAFAVNINVTGTVSDPGATITLTVDARAPLTVNKPTAATTWSQLVTDLTTGQHTLTGVARNAAGEEVRASVAFSVLPSLRFTITSPANGATCRSDGICTGSFPYPDDDPSKIPTTTGF